MNKKSALVLCLADPSMNPRPNRMITLLNSLGFNVDCVGYKITQSKPVGMQSHIEIPQRSSPFTKGQNWLLAFLGALEAKVGGGGIDKIQKERLRLITNQRLWEKRVRHKQYAIYVVENPEFLPGILEIRGSGKVIFDAREIYTREFENSKLWKMIYAPLQRAVLENSLRECDDLITVSTGIANEYHAEFGVNMTVVRSTPRYKDSANIGVHKRHGIVYHGGVNGDRKLQDIITMATHLDERFFVDMYLVGSKYQISKLRGLLRKSPNVRILPPVPFHAIHSMLLNYNIGLCIYPPANANIRNALPNKLFEYIQARLCVFASPLDEISAVIREFNCGVVGASFEPVQLAMQLNELSDEDISNAKKMSDAAAKILCWETESKIAETLINNIMQNREPADLELEA